MRATRRVKLTGDLAPIAAACAVLCAASVTPAQSFLVDFGPAAFFSGPALTASPDANGNAWNNYQPGQAIRLVDTSGGVSASGSPQGILLSAVSSIGVSLFDDEGLLEPDPAALAALAVESATRDFVFRLSNNGTDVRLVLDDLDPTLVYGLRLFGSIANGPADGETRYTVTGGGGAQTVPLATTGNEAGVAVVSGVTPRSDGTIGLRLEAQEGRFMHLNAMELTVEDAPPVVFFTQQPSTVIVDGGGAVAIEVAAQSDEPGLQIRWERDGVPVVDGERVSGAETGTLTITSARLEDAGLYRAVATNGPTEVVSDTAVVAVRWSDEDAADTDANGAVNFFDVLRFLQSFDEETP
jgi:hypothetical protein